VVGRLCQFLARVTKLSVAHSVISFAEYRGLRVVNFRAVWIARWSSASGPLPCAVIDRPVIKRTMKAINGILIRAINGIFMFLIVLGCLLFFLCLAPGYSQLSEEFIR